MIAFLKRIVSFFFTLLYLLRRVPDAIRGRRFLRNADPDVFYIINPCNIGDIVISAVAAKYLNTQKRVVILMRRAYSTMQGTLGSAECVADNKTLSEIHWYIRLTKKYSGSNYIYGHFKYDKWGLVFQRDTSISAWEDYCRNVFHIPCESLHNCYSAANSAPDGRLGDNDIVLAPYAKTVQSLPASFWLELSRRLQSLGYTVHTNVAGKEEPVPGTKPFVCRLDELCGRAEGSACFIMLRSGLCDLLAVYSLTNLLIVNRPGFISDMSEDDRAECYDVTYLRDKDVKNFMFDEAKQADLIDEIVASVQKSKEDDHES